MVDRPESEDAPSTRLVAAWLELDTLNHRHVPMWAAQWIVDGLDTPALRDLAGLDGTDPIGVRELTAKALNELGVELQDLGEAAELALTNEAELCLAGRVDERAVVAAVDGLYVRSGHADEIVRQPLGAEHGLADEWTGGWGRSDAQLRESVRAACRAQIAHDR